MKEIIIVIVGHTVGLEITVIAPRKAQSIPFYPQVDPNDVSHRTFLCFEMGALGWEVVSFFEPLRCKVL